MLPALTVAALTCLPPRKSNADEVEDGETFTDDSQNGSHSARVDEKSTRDEHEETDDFEDEVDDGENSRVFPATGAKEGAMFFVHIQSIDRSIAHRVVVRTRAEEKPKEESNQGVWKPREKSARTSLLVRSRVTRVCIHVATFVARFFLPTFSL